jgi:hypothetical protein
MHVACQFNRFHSFREIEFGKYNVIADNRCVTQTDSRAVYTESIHIAILQALRFASGWVQAS